VPGMQQLDGGRVRWQVEQDLSLGGEYRVTSTILDAGDFGVPQCRPRLLFLGVRSGLGLPEHPRGAGAVAALRLARLPEGGYGVAGDARADLLEALADPEDPRVVTCAQALGDLLEPGAAYSRPPASAYQRAMRAGSTAPCGHVPSRIREDTLSRLAAIPPGGNVHDLPAALARRYLTAARWGPAGDGERLARRHYNAYRRLHPGWLAWTANTKADFAYHYSLPRGLSVREVARLQGFRDAFAFATAAPGTPGQLRGGARHSLYRQVGNAVPPPLAAAAGSALLATLERGAGRRPAAIAA